MNMMRIARLALGALLAAGVAEGLVAQSDLEQLRDEKLRSAFLTKASWLTNFDKARAKAQKEGKIIFAYFARSYAP